MISVCLVLLQCCVDRAAASLGKKAPLAAGLRRSAPVAVAVLVRLSVCSPCVFRVSPPVPPRPTVSARHCGRRRGQPRRSGVQRVGVENAQRGANGREPATHNERRCGRSAP